MIGLQKLGKNDSIDDLVMLLVDPEKYAASATPLQLEQLEYYEMADNLITRYGTMHPTPSLLYTRINRKREEQGKEPISLRTAYNYVRNAQALFGSVRTIDKPYWRQLMIQKEFARYLKAVEVGNDKAAKAASEEMRRWGAFHVDDANQIDKREIGSKNQVLVINLGDKALQIDLDDTFSIPKEKLQMISQAVDEYNLQRMMDNLSKNAQDAEYTAVDAQPLPTKE